MRSLCSALRQQLFLSQLSSHSSPLISLACRLSLLSTLQVMDPSRARPMVGPVEGSVPGISRLLHHAYASDRVHCMHLTRGMLCPWTCACVPGVNEALRRSRFVQVFDNRVEINEPSSHVTGCCSCVVRDRVSVLYFDRAVVQNSSRADSCCAPNCAHGDLAPECCGLYGQTLLLHADRQGCCSACGHACQTVDTDASTHCSNAICPLAVSDTADCLWPCLPCFPSSRKLVYGMENAAELAQKIDAARALKGAPRAQPPF